MTDLGQTRSFSIPISACLSIPINPISRRSPYAGQAPHVSAQAATPCFATLPRKKRPVKRRIVGARVAAPTPFRFRCESVEDRSRPVQREDRGKLRWRHQGLHLSVHPGALEVLDPLNRILKHIVQPLRRRVFPAWPRVRPAGRGLPSPPCEAPAPYPAPGGAMRKNSLLCSMPNTGVAAPAAPISIIASASRRLCAYTGRPLAKACATRPASNSRVA